MPLSSNEKALEQQMRNVRLKNLTPEQKYADMEAISQALELRTRRKRQGQGYALVALCAAVAIVLAFGLVNKGPDLYRMGFSLNENIHRLPPELRPVTPNSISKEAAVVYRNGVANHGFLTYNNYYYVATNLTVENESELGEQLGKIKRSGGEDGVEPIANLESYSFAPNGVIFSLQGIDPKERIAYQIYSGGQKGSVFLVFQRATPLGQRPLETYTGAKGGAEGVAKTLENIRQSFPNFYELDGHESQIKQIIYQPMNGPGAFLSYVYQNQYLDIYEYQIGMEDSKDSILPDEAIYRGTGPAPRTFTQNGIHWSMYADDLYRGEIGNYYYVVRPHGQSFEAVRGLLQDFKLH
jgi:hypothetical protein